MIRVGRPWNLLLLLMGPRPSSLLHSTRSDKSSPEGDTPCHVVVKKNVSYLCTYDLYGPIRNAFEGADTLRGQVGGGWALEIKTFMNLYACYRLLLISNNLYD